MALHHELAELRAEVGPHVFDDPVAFRAAFDDFIPEGSASTGEVSLLVGAIATGALQRLREQLAIGADPETSIAVQADLLARDRGTTESSGARWALSVLAHAMGAIPPELVPTRPTPSPDSTRTAGRPPGSTPPVAVPSPAAPPTAGLTPTRAIGEPPAPLTAATAEPDRRAGRRITVLIGAVVVLAVVAATALVLLFLRDGDSPDDSSNPTSDSSANDGEELLEEIEMSEAGKKVRVQLVHDGTDAYLVLLVDRDGEYVEVDRYRTPCPYLDTSYDAGLMQTGDDDISWGWQNRGTSGYGEYGDVQIADELLDPYGIGDAPCPGEG